ncbi:glycosyltransferase family 2 protein [Corynebacterium glaucum]|uniref:glycosyltransferase family 2 protein n=1 Tax=Corynebacterium glaucum TaxID=187491 RepID=UPI0025B41D33|nr:glycosyltransferase family A protein [Corynebacterium glaucum]WJZ08633.1 Putative glycosyltransferase EpsH [Corynebacterium glaucum]
MDNVSVCICAYNPGPLLVYQLRAVLRQLQDGDELLLIDDASTDGSVQRAADEVEGSERITLLVNEKNLGISGSRNRAIEQAKYERIAFCDADDIVAPGWLDALRAHLAEHKFVGCKLDIDALNSQAAKSSLPHSATEYGLPVWYGGYPYIVGAGFGLHREVYEAAGPFDTDLNASEDVDFSVRANLAGFEPFFAEDAVVYYRLRPSLRAIFRQNRLYGRGGEMLLAKLSAQSEEFRAALAEVGEEPPVAKAGSVTPQRIARAIGNRIGRLQAKRG